MLTIGQTLLLIAFLYLAVGVFWVIRNHGSTLARLDRREWIRQGKPWKLVVVPLVVMLIWPLAAYIAWRIKRAMANGEWDRMAKQVKEEWEREGKLKNGHIVGMHDDPHQSTDR